MNSIKEFVKKAIRLVQSRDSELDYVNRFCSSLNHISIDNNDEFFYPFNPEYRRILLQGKTIICSNTVDFSTVLDSSIEELFKQVSTSPDKHYRKVEKKLLRGLELFWEKINNNGFPDLLYRKPISFKEAIQKILFYDALFWQANHWHVGLGRLDIILFNYYYEDLKFGKITKDDAKELLIKMLDVLDKDILSKSGVIPGDTGQYILISGIDEKGNIVCNDLTYLFLEIFKNYKKPDPKLIIRVSEKTPDDIWFSAAECAVTGSGSPLFINEDLIMKSMVEFGYDKADVYNFGTSACWEPLVIGKSFDQNNSLAPLQPLKVLNDLILECHHFDSFSLFFKRFKESIGQELEVIIHDIDFDCSPLYSLFFQSCSRSGKDYTKGGADYNYHGVQVVGFSNTINALLNIKKYVFDSKIFSMEECKNLIKSNFSSSPEIIKLLKSNNLAFGSTNPEVVNLTNDLMIYISDAAAKHSVGGNKVKIGFSSPNFIESARSTQASMDGRRDHEPLGVHISPISSNIDFFEVLEFSTKLDYGQNRINGNVLDFPIPQVYLNHPDKLALILKDACRKGSFEIQLSVLDHKKLIEAKQYPERYPNLLVRVWGFSAYFNDLPEEYKDNIISRAKLYERT